MLASVLFAGLSTGAAAAISLGMVAAGVGAMVVARRPPSTRPSGQREVDSSGVPFNVVVALVTGGGPAQTTEDDDAIMRSPNSTGNFTSFFTREVEREVVSRFQAYRNQQGISSCSPVPAPKDWGDLLAGDPGFKYLREAERATVQVLFDLYPTGAPWSGEAFWDIVEVGQAEISVSLWRWWLFHRVYKLAEQHVCHFSPVF